MPTRCNRDFYCRSYCLLNMFRAPLCPSSGAQEYYTVVAACGIPCCGFQVAVLVWSWGLCVWFAGCCFSITLSSTPDQQLENHSTKYHRQQPLYNTLELLMIGTSYRIIYFRGSVQDCKSIRIWKMVTLIQSVQNNYNIWYINNLT